MSDENGGPTKMVMVDCRVVDTARDFAEAVELLRQAIGGGRVEVGLPDFDDRVRALLARIDGK